MSKNFATSQSLAQYFLEKGKHYCGVNLTLSSMENLRRLAEGDDDNFVIYLINQDKGPVCYSDRDLEFLPHFKDLGWRSDAWNKVENFVKALKKPAQYRRRSLGVTVVACRCTEENGVFDKVYFEPAFCDEISWTMDAKDTEQNYRMHLWQERLKQAYEDVCHTSASFLDFEFVPPQGVANPLDRWFEYQRKLLEVATKEERTFFVSQLKSQLQLAERARRGEDISDLDHFWF